MKDQRMLADWIGGIILQDELFRVKMMMEIVLENYFEDLVA